MGYEHLCQSGKKPVPPRCTASRGGGNASGAYELSGATAAVLILALSAWLLASYPTATATVLVTFEAHAPGAQRVELVGNFNNWMPGAAVMRGPDATGRWTLQLRLPPGRHEYQFLVDGRIWQTDPQAPLWRPDGFGHENAVVDI